MGRVMRRTGFKRERPPRTPPPVYALVRQCAAPRVEADPRPAPKAGTCRSERYRRLVAAMPCIRCGIHGHSQAAHPNTGKGAGMKAEDALCFPLCADRPGVRGCHSLFDQGGLYTREERRQIEPQWSARTAAAIQAAGLWPAELNPLA